MWSYLLAVYCGLLQGLQADERIIGGMVVEGEERLKNNPTSWWINYCLQLTNINDENVNKKKFLDKKIGLICEPKHFAVMRQNLAFRGFQCYWEKNPRNSLKISVNTMNRSLHILRNKSQKSKVFTLNSKNVFYGV